MTLLSSRRYCIWYCQWYVPFIDAVVPVSWQIISASIFAPFIKVDQYFLFLISAKENTAFFINSTIACSTQKPLSSITTLPLDYIPLVRRSSRPDVFPFSSKSTQKFGASFPSTISTQNKMLVRPSAIVWYSLPKGWGMRLTRNEDPPGTGPLVNLYWNRFIKTTYPWWNIVLVHDIIPCADQLSHLPKFVNHVCQWWWWSRCNSKTRHDLIESIFMHDIIQPPWLQGLQTQLQPPCPKQTQRRTQKSENKPENNLYAHTRL